MTFHLSNCIISDEKTNHYFEVIQDGCAASIVDTTLLSDKLFQQKAVNWSFRSFQFSKNQINAELNLSCRVQFCLSSEREEGNCLNGDYIENFPCKPGYIMPIGSSVVLKQIRSSKIN